MTDLPLVMSNHIPQKSQDRIYALLADGCSIRDIKEKLGHSENTVRGYRKLWIAAGNAVPICECGQPVSHRAWCAPRLSRHPVRQAWIARGKGQGRGWQSSPSAVVTLPAPSAAA